ncbi:MAG: hypothetical protein OXC05_06980 [Halieaceae bacterium]|nr:hypothetical protein [Halieaceae bacterium]
MMNTKSQIMCVWSGVAFFMLFFIACWPLAQFIPPPSPTLTSTEILERYQDNINMIRLAMPLGIISAIFFIPWSAVIAVQLAAIEGRRPVWAITVVAAGVCNTIAFLLPFVFWAPGVYRLERDPELIFLFSDFAWLEFVMFFPQFTLMAIAIAVAGLMDKRDRPFFPRWICFLNLWVGLLVAPGGLAIFFKSGPFAWNGILAFWTPVVVFTIYFSCMVPIMLQGIYREAKDSSIQHES